MNLRRFKASNAKQAIEDVLDALGPDAVIVNIRKVSKPGLQGLFKSQQVEVSVLIPEQSRMASNKTQAVESIEQVARTTAPEVPVNQRSENIYGTHLDLVDDTLIEIPKSSACDDDREVPNTNLDESTVPPCCVPEELWGAGQVLESIGILPLYIERLTGLAKRRFPQFENVSIKEQLKQIRFCIIDHWTGLASEAKKNAHSRKLLLGPPGCGKTTALCKWMTRTVLAKRESARVWRLDGHLANTAEMLTVHAEMLGVPVDRVWKTEEFVDSATQFIDLPGVIPNDAEGMKSIVSLTNQVQPAECLLVLNSAYELDHLVRLVRSFSDLPINGLMMTHLDEETKWSKLWNLTLATDLPILYWSGGQEMPGDFVETTPKDLFGAVIRQLEYEESTLTGDRTV